MAMQFRVLGRFYRDRDPKFQGPHRAYFDCDAILPDGIDVCPVDPKHRVDRCGGPRRENFLGCIRCDKEAR